MESHRQRGDSNRRSVKNFQPIVMTAKAVVNLISAKSNQSLESSSQKPPGELLEEEIEEQKTTEMRRLSKRGSSEYIAIKV